jgi:hypothetical protein
MKGISLHAERHYILKKNCYIEFVSETFKSAIFNQTSFLEEFWEQTFPAKDI